MEAIIPWLAGLCAILAILIFILVPKRLPASESPGARVAAGLAVLLLVAAIAQALWLAQAAPAQGS